MKLDFKKHIPRPSFTIVVKKHIFRLSLTMLPRQVHAHLPDLREHLAMSGHLCVLVNLTLL